MTEASPTVTRHLNFKGRVDPTPGSKMEPNLDGVIYTVVGSVHDAETNMTRVELEQAAA